MKISLKKGFLLSLASLTLLGIVQQTTAQTKPETAPSADQMLEPQALKLLKTMSETLAAARSMTFTSITTYESPSLIGPPLVYTTISEVTLERPNKLRVITPGDGPANEFYYNGKSITAYSPAENLVATSEAPSTIDAALKMAYDSAAIYFPFTDVVVENPYKDIAEGLKMAFVIGQSQVIGGTKTDMIGLVNDKIFAQVWIGADDKLPRMIRAVYRDDPSRLRHQVEFKDWQLNGAIAADTFAPSKTQGASSIPFARPEPKPSPSPTDKP
ncbi:DUF2092 domain-containing protein [Crocosphaera sp. UHCC 0190]|uniref:DUF2092 domain-containing protein n=1 Tax=Crocosphaera sp. UHCC 0190 TaxID=3110246 RepID=UPI002B1F5657|nr:DUF2092 domain-containing protein [Crocosphaera sp. UHCC 0190]MEA5508538.1 DUF2092 domain-containing protein [Crocosphaera sp. UHCC 0190]